MVGEMLRKNKAMCVNKIKRVRLDALLSVSLIKNRMPEVCSPPGIASWYRFRWKVKVYIDRVQKEQVAPETQD